MDQKPISDAVKKILYNHLAEVMLSSVENGTLSFEDGQISSQYILNQFDNLKTYPDLISFLQDLSVKWPIYSSVLTYLLSLEQEHKDEKKLDKIEEELQDMIQQ